MICGKSYSFRIRFPKEYAFTKTFESVFEEDTFFNSCLQGLGVGQDGGTSQIKVNPTQVREPMDLPVN